MQPNKKFSRGLMLVLLVAVTQVVGNMAFGSEARKRATANNPMVLDDTDVVDFPGLLGMFSNIAFINLYPASPWGNAGAFVGESIILGGWVNRTPTYRDHDMTASVFNLDLPDTYQLADLFFGMENGFGLRVAVAAGLSTVESQTDPPDTDLNSDGASTLGLDLMPGYTLSSGAYRGDFGLGVSVAHYEVAVNGLKAYTSRFIPSVLLRHRSVLGAEEAPTAWIIDLTLTRRSYDATNEGSNDQDGWFGHWMAQLTLGPRIRLGNFTLWPGLQVGWERLSGEIDNTKQPALTGISAPGLIVSAELLLWDFFTIRGGAAYDIYWTISSVPDPTDDDEIAMKQRGMGQRFSWSTGVGFALDAFQIDATVSRQLYFNGPAIIGGDNPGMLGMISAAYMW
jgi:hypothetical protein